MSARLIDKAAPGERHVTTTGPSMVGAYFAVIVWWNPEGFWEPWDTGIGRFATGREAYDDAKVLGESEDLPVIRDPRFETAEAKRSMSIHPALSGLIDSIGNFPACAAQAQRDAYVKLLLRHDWSHEFSDDGSVAARGRRQLAELRSVQHAIDPTFEVWNQHCPTQCKNGAAYT